MTEKKKRKSRQKVVLQQKEKSSVVKQIAKVEGNANISKIEAAHIIGKILVENRIPDEELDNISNAVKISVKRLRQFKELAVMYGSYKALITSEFLDFPHKQVPTIENLLKRIFIEPTVSGRMGFTLLIAQKQRAVEIAEKRGISLAELSRQVFVKYLDYPKVRELIEAIRSQE